MSNTYRTVKFTEYQLKKFELVSTEKMKNSLKSVLSHLYIKNAEMNRNEYDKNKKTYELTISISKFLRYYNCSTSKRNSNKRKLGYKELPLLTISSLRKRIKKLTELGLIKNISTGTHDSTFIFFEEERQYLSANSGTSENVAESTEDTSVEADEEIHSPESLQISKDLDTKEPDTVSETDTKELDIVSKTKTKENDSNFEMDYDSYIQQERKVDNMDTLSHAFDVCFKACKVRSGWIKTSVIASVTSVYNKITVKHLHKYICMAIQNARIASQSKYQQKVLNKNNSNIYFGTEDYTFPEGINNFEELEDNLTSF